MPNNSFEQMRCLYIFEDAPLDASYSGGSARFCNTFDALTQLQIETHVVRFVESTNTKIFSIEEYSTEAQQRKKIAKTWTDISYKINIHAQTKIIDIMNNINALQRIAFPHLTFFENIIQEHLNKNTYDFIITESILPALSFLKINTTIPSIFSHHDFMYRIERIRWRIYQRDLYPMKKIKNKLLEWAEKKMIQKSNAIISGSTTEALYISKNLNPNTFMIPTLYPSIELSKKQRDTPYIYHFGALTTTANYASLSTYFEKIYPLLSKTENNNQLKTYIVGNPTVSKPDLMHAIHQHHGEILGHIQHLDSVFYPGDIQILAYEEDTGTRTKIPLLMNYAQVIVALKPGVQSLDYLEHEKNCFIAESYEDFARIVSTLHHHPHLRERIAYNAKKTFEQHWLQHSYNDVYAQAIQTACALPFSINTSRGLAPSAGPTNPSRSMRSTIRAERL